MKKIAALAALSVSALAMSSGASFADYTLTIMHINDWHSRIESNNKFESTCSAEDETKGECIGGAARLVTAIAERRKALEGQNSLLLNAGDNFQGSMFYTTYKGAVEAEFLNQMKFDAMAVGNHEFDDGEEALVPFLEKVQFPVLSANVAPNAQSKVGDRIKPSVVIEVGGQKIGIVGAVTTDTPELASPGPNIAIEDDVAKITAEVEKLTAAGVNKIIALTHVGYVRDMEAIAKIPNVDVVVGGHSHTLLSNIAERKPAGPYPTMVDNPGGYKVPVTQAASYSKYLGEFAVTFDDNGVVKEAKGEPLFLDKAITPDAAVLARIKELGAPIEELKNKVVSAAAAPIDGSRDSCRTRECEMGNLVSDAILDRVKDQGVTIVIQNGGGLRASIDAGEITMGEVLNVLPFQNTLATFQLAGKDLIASLEQGVSEVAEGKGKFPQVAGLRYTADLGVAPNGGRIKSVETSEGGNWVALDPAKTYTIATNNFVRGGGDGYKLFSSNAQNAYDFGPSLEQVVADYLAANNPYQAKLDGRITIVAAPAAVEEKPAAQPAPAAPAAAPAAPAPEKAAETAAPAKDAGAKLPDLPAMSNTIAAEPPKLTAEETAKAAAELAAAEAAKKAAADKAAADKAAADKAAADKAAADKAAADKAAADKAAADKAAADKAAADKAAADKAAADKAAADKAAADKAAADKAAADKAAADKAAADKAAADKAAADKMAAEKAAADKAAADKASAMVAPKTAAPTAQPVEAAAKPEEKYMIAKGDNYWKLAEKFYGDGMKWPMLAKANPDYEETKLPIGAPLTVPAAN